MKYLIFIFIFILFSFQSSKQKNEYKIYTYFDHSNKAEIKIKLMNNSKFQIYTDENNKIRELNSGTYQIIESYKLILFPNNFQNDFCIIQDTVNSNILSANRTLVNNLGHPIWIKDRDSWSLVSESKVIKNNQNLVIYSPKSGISEVFIDSNANNLILEKRKMCKKLYGIRYWNYFIDEATFSYFVNDTIIIGNDLRIMKFIRS